MAGAKGTRSLDLFDAVERLREQIEDLGSEEVIGLAIAQAIEETAKVAELLDQRDRIIRIEEKVDRLLDHLGLGPTRPTLVK